LTECLTWRVKDLDLERSELIVRRGKGRKERATVVPDTLRRALREHLEWVRRLHVRDLAAGAGWVQLPGGLNAKYPNAAWVWPWQWQWVFPARRRYRDAGSRGFSGITSMNRPCNEP
jgi:integrase